MVANKTSVAAGIGQRDDKSHGTADPLRESGPFELCRADLSLEIHEGTLDLDVHDRSRSFEQHVCCSPILRGTDRDLETDAPGRS
jgi:hypothetical protein